MIPDFTWIKKILCRHHEHPRFFAKNADSRLGGYVRTEKQFLTLRQNPGWDIYLHLNPTDNRRASPKAAGSDVTLFTNMLVDIDVLDGRPDLYSISMFVLGQLEALIEGSTNACHMVFSGRGFQLWVPFDPYPLTDAKERRMVESACKNVLQKLVTGSSHCKVDTSCSDLARVARCPGTVNTKSGLTAELVSIGEGVADLRQLLTYATPPQAKQTLNLTSATSVGYVLPYVSARAADFLSVGVSEPGRHAAAYAAAASLRELEIPLEVAEIWVAEAGHLCNPSLSPAECYRATRNAYRYESL